MKRLDQRRLDRQTKQCERRITPNEDKARYSTLKMIIAMEHWTQL